MVKPPQAPSLYILLLKISQLLHQHLALEDLKDQAKSHSTPVKQAGIGIEIN
jgi:hypothetical protein